MFTSNSFLNICKQYYTAVQNKYLFKIIYDNPNETFENEALFKIINVFLKGKSVKVHNLNSIYIFTQSNQTSTKP